MTDFADRLSQATSNLDALTLADLDDEPPPPKRGSTGANLEPVKHGAPHPSADGTATVLGVSGAGGTVAPTQTLLDVSAGAAERHQALLVPGTPVRPTQAIDTDAAEAGRQTQRLGSAEPPVPGVVHTGGVQTVTMPQLPGGVVSAPPEGLAMSPGAELVHGMAAAHAEPGMFPLPYGSVPPTVPVSLQEQLRSDPVVLGCLGFILGLALAIIPAVNAAERVRVPLQAPLLEELQLSVKHPLSVAAGERRAPEVIQSDVRAGYPKVVLRYYSVWFGVGFPLGAVLALLAIRFVRRE